MSIPTVTCGRASCATSLPDGSLADYIALIQKKFGANFVPEDVYVADLLSALGCIDVGVTTVLDWSHIQNSPEHTDAAIKGLQESGVRAVFAYGNPQTASGNWKDAPKHKYPGDIARLRKQYFNSDDQLDDAVPRVAGRRARRTSCRSGRPPAMSARASPSMSASASSAATRFLEKVHAIEPLRSDTTYVHCCTLNDTEWKLIKDSGGTVSIAGYVEKLMGHGNPPVQKAIDLGIRPSLSVDVETSVPNDFFNQMRSVFSQQKNEVWESGCPATRTRRSS